MVNRGLLIALPLVLFVVSASPVSAQTPSGLTNGKLTACQARESVVKNRMDSLVRLVTNMENKFDSITTRVENYYTNKVVPSGKNVSNYSFLVNDISAKKSTVTTALTKAQTDASGFSCTSGDPKSLLNQFRLDMQAVKAALKDYRTSIKNLIVAVRGVK